MSARVPVTVTARRRLTSTDSAHAWAFLADFRHLPAWTTAHSVDWHQELPSHGSTFSSVHRLGVIRYRLESTVTDWAAGRAFTLEIEGFPAAQDVEVSLVLDAYVAGGEPISDLELAFRGTARRQLAPVVRWRARRTLERSLRRLERRLR